ncbi:MAG: hypothetical protein C4531_12060 [Desulfurivibrio sp.]|nr:MAG: hypothetical protein C4531_12060 [Desulfurivibrio sp.]
MISQDTREALAMKTASGRTLGESEVVLRKSRFDQNVERIKESAGCFFSESKIAKLQGTSKKARVVSAGTA